MEYPDYEKLFLLEVLVESVFIDNSKLNLDTTHLKETCVMFQFLDYPPLVVCEEDWLKSAPRHGPELTFNSGKSCMFPINSKSVPQLPYQFDINVSVLRKEEVKEEGKVVLGTCKLDLGDSFSAIMHSSVAEPDLPLQRTKAGTYDILDRNSKPVGHLTAFVRLSCFGQLIVTQFQAGDSSDFLFKGTETKKVVEIPGDSSKIPKFEVDTSYRPKEKMERPASMFPLQESYYSIPSKTSVTTQAPEEDDTGDYKEIVAELRGHTLQIRIPMKSRKEKEEIICKKRLMAELEDDAPICSHVKPPKLCDCDFPLPPEAIASMTPRCPRY